MKDSLEKVFLDTYWPAYTAGYKAGEQDAIDIVINAFKAAGVDEPILDTLRDLQKTMKDKPQELKIMKRP